jgi:hypothetical protein
MPFINLEASRSFPTGKKLVSPIFLSQFMVRNPRRLRELTGLRKLMMDSQLSRGDD